MGRWSWSNRTTVEECKSIDISWLNRHGYFSGFKGGSFKWENARGEETGSIGILVSVDDDRYIRLSYSLVNREKTKVDYKVELVSTPCNLGGLRYWFICPLVVEGRPCGKRVGKLYLPPRGQYFGCRTCHNLTYRSCKEHDKRVDALLRDPVLLAAQMGRDRVSMVTLKACFKILK